MEKHHTTEIHFFSKRFDVYSLCYCRLQIEKQKKNSSRTQTTHTTLSYPPGLPVHPSVETQLFSCLQILFIHYGPILLIIKVNLGTSNPTEANEHANMHSHKNKCLHVESDNKNILVQASKLAIPIKL